MRDSIAHHCMLADEFTLTTLATEEGHRSLVLQNVLLSEHFGQLMFSDDTKPHHERILWIASRTKLLENH